MSLATAALQRHIPSRVAPLQPPENSLRLVEPAPPQLLVESGRAPCWPSFPVGSSQDRALARPSGQFRERRLDDLFAVVPYEHSDAGFDAVDGPDVPVAQ